MSLRVKSLTCKAHDSVRSSVDRKRKVLGNLRSAMQAVFDAFSGTKAPNNNSDEVGRKRPLDKRPQKAQSRLYEAVSRISTERGENLQLDDVAERILRDANGALLSPSDVARIAERNDPRFKTVANLSKRFKALMTQRKDFDRQGAFFRIAKNE